MEPEMSLTSASLTIDELYLKKAENRGREIYNTKQDMRAISRIMEDPDFMSSYNKHFNDWFDVKIFVMFMKVYGEISKKYPNLTGNQKLAILSDIIDDAPTRKLVCDMMSKFAGETNLLK